MGIRKKRCAYLTMDSTEGWEIDADLSFGPMQALGWSIDMVPWTTTGVDWDRYDAVYICTPWDYPDDPALFMELLEAVDQSSAVLVNDLALVRWTISKTYLRDLESRGAAIVPSIWRESFDPESLPSFFDDHGTDRIIIKPVVSTNAHDTFLLDSDETDETLTELQSTFAARAFVVQPFIENVQAEGEFSLFYFSNEFSHAILKTPKDRDFRVQEEHGASIVAVIPEQYLLDTAARVLSLVEPVPVYARCDFLRGPDGQFLLMELEVVEPSMYLRMDEAAPTRFARAVDAYVARRRAPSSGTDP
ncbi:MAG: RimK family alpha-L-glutamate ligase [Woeseia sp.]